MEQTEFYIDSKDLPRCEQPYREQQRITLVGVTEAGQIRAFTGVVRNAEHFPDAAPGRQWRITIANR